MIKLRSSPVIGSSSNLPEATNREYNTCPARRAALPRRFTMATYIVLANFTEQGIRNVRDTTKRADVFKDLAKTFGANVKIGRAHV